MADMEKINEARLEDVSGGGGDYSLYSKGKYINFGDHVLYFVAPDDTLRAIAYKFGVTVDQIAEWNNIKNINLIYVGQQLTIYHTRIW